MNYVPSMMCIIYEQLARFSRSNGMHNTGESWKSTNNPKRIRIYGIVSLLYGLYYSFEIREAYIYDSLKYSLGNKLLPLSIKR